MSVQGRYTAAVGCIIALIVAMMVWSNMAGLQEAERFKEQTAASLAEGIVTRLVEHYEANGEWVDVSGILIPAEDLLHWDVFLFDGDGEAVSGSLLFTGNQEDLTVVPLYDDAEERIGTLLIAPRVGAPGPATADPSGPFRYTLALAGMVAAVGLGLVYVMSRRTFQSVDRVEAVIGRFRQQTDTPPPPDSAKGVDGDLDHLLSGLSQRLEDTENQQRSALAEISHELRGPLSNLQGYSEIMHHQVQTFLEEMQKYSEGMRYQLVNLSRQLEDIRQLESMRDEDELLDVQEAELPELLSACANAYESKAAEHGITFTLENGDDIPPMPLDEARIVQVVNNLLDNAFAYTPEGGEVKLSAWAEHDNAIITVQDTGKGIPADALPRIFQRFFHEPDGRRGPKGSGLGLAIAKQIVEIHHGSIEVESEEGKGSQFWLTLPLRRTRAN
ncbi:MAG: HAMP domain-containing sensor histidine kinase [Dehalococcoidia bacterium]